MFYVGGDGAFGHVFVALSLEGGERKSKFFGAFYQLFNIIYIKVEKLIFKIVFL